MTTVFYSGNPLNPEVETSALLLPILKKAQKEHGHLSEEVLKRISKETKIPISRIYGVATFYSMLHTTKPGKTIIEVCGSPSCCVNGALDLVGFLEAELKVKAGETTKDGKFSLHKTSCIGCCDEAPAMLFNGKPCTNLTKEKITKLLSEESQCKS